MLPASSISFRTWVIIGLAWLVLSTSCTVEKQLAQSFLQGWKPPAVMVIPPPVILMENLRPATYTKTQDSLTQESDSMLVQKSTLLHSIEEAIFLDGFVNAMISALRQQGYVVFIPAVLDTFLTYSGDAYVLDMAQVLIEEYDLPVTERAVFDETIYYKKFMLNTVSISSWFELSRMNVVKDERRLLFANHKISDQLKGKFSQHPFTGEVLYHYNLNYILLEDVYALASTLGKKYAGHLTDYFINLYIANNLPEGVSPDSWYHLDPKSGKLYRNWNDYFIELPAEK